MTDFDPNERDGRGLGSAILFVIAAAGVGIISLLAYKSARSDVCWTSGITPGGNHYTVRYVPREAINIAASGQAHDYVPVAVAFPGGLWVADDAPCNQIPWDHEEKHLDGWWHYADGKLRPPSEIRLTEKR